MICTILLLFLYSVTMQLSVLGNQLFAPVPILIDDTKEVNISEFFDEESIELVYSVENATSSVSLTHILPISNNSGVQLLGAYNALGNIAYFSEYSKEYLPNHNLTFNILDDSSDSALASLHIMKSFSLAKKSSSGIMGAINSEVSKDIGRMTGPLSQFQLSCSSTSGQLSNKSIYPTLMQLLPNDETAAAVLVRLVQKYGWKRFVLVHTTDSFGAGQAEIIFSTAQKLGIEVSTVISIPYNSRRNNSTSYKLLRNGFNSAKQMLSSVFILSAVGDDVQYVMEIAGRQNVLGFGKVWIGGDWSLDMSINWWKYANDNPHLFEGVFSVRIDCDIDSDMYYALGNKTKNYFIDKHTVYSCVAYDCSKVYLVALNKTFDRMISAGIDTQCIERKFFLDNLAVCNDTFSAQVSNELYQNSSCAGKCTVCGLCEMFEYFEHNKKDNTYFFHVWEALLLYEAHQVKFWGATGPLSFNRYGDRNESNTEFVILNSHFDRNKKTFKFVQLESVTDPTLQKDGEIFDVKKRFAPASINTINFEKPKDKLPYNIQQLSMWICIIWTIVITGTLFLFSMAIYLFLRNRDQLVIKTSSIPLMLAISFGGFLSFSSVVVLIWFGSTQEGCIIFTWLRAVGFVTSYGALFLKTYRVKIVFGNPTKQDSSLGNEKLFSVLCASVLCLCVYLSIWTWVEYDNFVVIEHIGNSYTDVAYICYKPKLFQWILFGAEVSFLILGSVLAYTVRNAPAFFNEAKIIAFCIYNWFFLAVIGQLIVALTIDLSPELYYCLVALVIFSQYSVTVGCLYFHKLHICWKGRGNEKNKTKMCNKPLTSKNGDEPECSPLSQINANLSSYNGSRSFSMVPMQINSRNCKFYPIQSTSGSSGNICIQKEKEKETLSKIISINIES